MKALKIGLVTVLVGLQYKLWMAEGSLPAAWQLRTQVEQVQIRNQVLQSQNNSIHAQVLELKQGTQALEEKARQDLGMIRPGETYFQIVD